MPKRPPLTDEEAHVIGGAYAASYDKAPTDPHHGGKIWKPASASGNHHTIMVDECPRCNGSGRNEGSPSKWGDGSPTDFGPCLTCGGSGELEQEFECRTLEDLEAEDEQR